MEFKRIAVLLSAAAISVALAGAASAQDKTVKIGVIFPLSGNAASAGVHGKAAIETAVEIINTGGPGLGNLPLTNNAGLKGLGGAKVEVVFADNQGSPAVGQNQALRLITEEKVVAITGAYQSGITLTASAIAEKYGIPFVNGESVAANLTERGFKWFFRVTPVASDFAKIYLEFLKDMKAGGIKTDNVAIVHENTEYGTSVASVITSVFKENGLAIAMDIPYAANTTDVQSQVLQLKDKKPDVVIMVSYTSDAILYAKTMQALDYKPPMIIADNSGFSDPSFIKTAGKLAQGLFNRSSFAIGAKGTPAFLINEMYKKKSGGDDLDDTAARQMQGFFVLAEAIDRAGSTEPAKIQAALKATDLKPDQLIMGYKGVKFDDKGQNVLAAGLVIQLQDGENYTPVWPKQLAKTAPVLPYKGW
ncbi:ABC transporter substrate-binding protein [Bradyrhizobium sp. KBS0727]|uniref:ABC transporter substrate-binding protein n=1 Tax=unclassified Bradyrhizobium TaxID=2631580 RepID=UPI00110EC5B3|nr:MULTISPECIES: ABC transporter substrate-binding protein [unclassified Bradyrhizobium]QDW38128.1 ABC transporter substrate-binding protein [Bradyrhizobium sp. KBS0725]QDW44732.1 ABC transporter substrate-binding protein [Bradyrhizobium sp. KBS0727]